MQKFHPIFFLSVSSALLLLTMILFGLSESSSQQQFELVDALNSYSFNLLDQAAPIRTIIGLDNIFIALYTSVIILIVIQLLAEKKASSTVLYIMLVGGLLAGTLDYLENFHIFTMLYSLENGISLDASEIKQQMVWSMLKWHLSYFVFFLLALVLKPKNIIEQLFCFSLLFIQLPVGVFFYMFEGTMIGDVLFYARYGNLVFGFLIVGVIFNIRLNSSP